MKNLDRSHVSLILWFSISTFFCNHAFMKQLQYILWLKWHKRWMQYVIFLFISTNDKLIQLFLENSCILLKKKEKDRYTQPFWPLQWCYFYSIYFNPFFCASITTYACRMFSAQNNEIASSTTLSFFILIINKKVWSHTIFFLLKRKSL